MAWSSTLRTIMIYLSLLLVSALTLSASADRPNYKICAYPDYMVETCRALEAGNSPISCLRVTDSVECAFSIINGTADFGEFHPEHAVLMSKMEDARNNLRVAAQLRFYSKVSDSSSVEAVAVVPTSFSGGLSDLKSKNYCQGFSSTSYTDRFAQHFEKKVVSTSCYDQLSGAEEKVARISSFFRQACRPGTWAEDFTLNSRLKQTYSNLCSLCDSKCEYARTQSVTAAALDCLTKKGGDVAYVSLSGVIHYFGLSSSNSNDSASNYQFLCPDGSVQALRSSTPCTWAQQPWSMILYSSNFTNTLNSTIFDGLDSNKPMDDGRQWAKTLQDKLLGQSRVAVATSQYLQDNIKRGVDDDSLGTSCRNPIKWCTISAGEKEKCEWIRTAANSFGMIPLLSCVSASHTTGCLSHIAKNYSDVMALDTEYGYLARKVYNLSNVAYEDSDRASSYKILAVIKLADQNKFSSFQKLKRRNACFPEFRGLGWISFLRALKESSIFNRNECPFDYFNSACAPGASDPRFLLYGETAPKRLCMLCPSANTTGQCEPTSNNPYHGNLGALKCLANSGDVAFVDYSRLQDRRGRVYEQVNASGLVVICRNGSLSSFPGLDVDDDCALATGLRGELVSGENKTGVRQRDISELFLKLSNWFGNLGSSLDTPLRMFEAFKGERNLLFKDGTIELVHNAALYETAQQYKNLVETVSDDCRSSSVIFAPSMLLTLFMISCTVLYI